MRAKNRIFSFLSLLFLIIPVINAQTEKKPLAEIYKKGKIRFIKELVISDSSLPEGEFFGQISSFAVDPNGNIYVLDYKANHIQKFNAKGEFIKTIGKKGQGPGDFNSPLDIEIVKDKLIVWDSMNMRISALDLDGTFIKSIPHDFMQLGWVYKIKALPNKKMILETQVSYRQGPSRPWECYLRLFSNDLEHIKDVYKKEFWTRKNITEPKNMSIPIPFSAKVCWDVTPNGNAVIGFSESYMIEIHDPTKGKISSFKHQYIPAKVTKEDKEQFFAGMVVSSPGGGQQQGAPDYIVKNTEFPKTKPAFDDIKCDPEGNIWIHTHCNDREEEMYFFDVFNEDGPFINRVKIEGHVYPYNGEMMDQYFYIVETDKEGYHTIVKYRITD